MDLQKRSVSLNRVRLAPFVRIIFETSGEQEHFFGYYDKSPFDAESRRLLCHAVKFPSTRMPTINDQAEIAYWDLQSAQRIPVTHTSAFNWQQGAMLQWLGPDFSSRIVFNDYRDGRYVAIVHQMDTGEQKILDNTIYSVTPDGRWAIGVNYERLFWCRHGYNYAWPGHPRYNVPISDEDGLHLVDIQSGCSHLIIRTRQVIDIAFVSGMNTGSHYLEHVLFSPSGKRFMFLHRWRSPEGGIFSRVFVANRDGSELKLLHDKGDVSHYTWRDDNTLMVFGSKRGYLNHLRRFQWSVNLILKPFRGVFKRLIRPGTFQERLLLRPEYLFINVLTGQIKSVDSRQLRIDGHPNFHPLRTDIFLTDTYPNRQNYRELYLFDVSRRLRINLGEFFSPPASSNTHWRADLHPRWDRKGNLVCIDSLHNERRQMVVLDVSNIIETLGISQSDLKNS